MPVPKPIIDLEHSVLPKGLPEGSPPAWHLGVLCAVIAAGFCLLNASLLPAIERSGPDEAGALWGTFCMGSIGGQAGLLAMAGVLGPFSAFRRHLVVIPIAAVLVYSWFLGVVIERTMHRSPFYPSQTTEITSVVLTLPLLFLLCELPLWVCRAFFRWRIESGVDSTAGSPQLSIAGILAATAAVALSLGAVRYGQSLIHVNEANWWFGIAVASGVALGISVCVLPAVAALVFRSEVLIIGMLVSAAWIFLLGIGTLGVISARMGSFPSREFHLFLSVLWGFIVTLVGPLALARTFGFQLRWSS